MAGSQPVVRPGSLPPGENRGPWVFRGIAPRTDRDWLWIREAGTR